jgi:Predicted permease.
MSAIGEIIRGEHLFNYNNANAESVNAKIKDVVLNHFADDKIMQASKPEIELFPMSKWKLYTDFENGKNVGGYIKYVRLFGILGVIVLLIACINFMNLSTARSSKRAKEIGIRKESWFPAQTIDRTVFERINAHYSYCISFITCHCIFCASIF